MRLRLFTASYGAILRDGWPADAQPVRTSVGKSRSLPELPSLKELTPYGLLKLEGEEFELAYRSRLEKYGVQAIRKALDGLAMAHGATTLILLCFEDDRAECHRGLFAAWWERATGERVSELLSLRA